MKYFHKNSSTSLLLLLIQWKIFMRRKRRTFHSFLPFTKSNEEEVEGKHLLLFHFICLMKSFFYPAFSPTTMKISLFSSSQLTSWNEKVFIFYFSLHLGRTWFVYGIFVLLYFQFSVNFYMNWMLRALTKYFSLILLLYSMTACELLL